jgi:aryl-alcohol dehydrogenase-like predicted oxidoreductase
MFRLESAVRSGQVRCLNISSFQKRQTREAHNSLSCFRSCVAVEKKAQAFLKLSDHAVVISE